MTAGATGRPAFGIAAKLYASLAVLAGLTLVATTIAWLAFDRIGDATDTVTGRAVPDMVAALDLARLAADVSSIAPGIAASNTQAARRREKTVLDERRSQIEAAIADLARRGVSTETTGQLSLLRSALDARLGELDNAVSQRLRAAAARTHQINRLARDRTRFETAFEVLIDDAVFDFVIGGEEASSGSAAAIADLVDGGIGLVDRMLTIQAQGNLAYGLLTEAVHLEDQVLAGPLRERFEAAAGAMERDLRQLDGETPPGLRRAVDDLLAYGRGAGSIFRSAGQEGGPRRNLEVLQQRLGSAHERFLISLVPLVDDAVFDLVMETERTSAANSAAVADLIGVGADTLYLLLAARAEGNLASGLLNQAATTDDNRLLVPLEERFDAAAVRIAETAGRLASPELAERVLAVADPVLAHGTGEDGLFALRRREIAHTAAAEAALDASQGLSVDLATQVSDLVSRARATSDDAALQAGATVDRGKIALIAISAAVLLVSGFVMLVYVRRQIVAPLGHITTAMRELAEGDTTVDIPCRDRGDEIGHMAAALGVFRDTALEVQRSNLRELQTARRRLADAIESISEAFSLYDADGRLIICNNRYQTLLYPGLAEEIEPGVTFEQIVRRAAEKGYVLDAVGRVEEWVAERIAQHENPGEPQIQQRFDGRWVMVSEHKTGEGGTVAVYSDITDLKEREAALASKSTALEQLSNQLAKYLAPQVYESIFTGRQEVTLTSRRKKLTIFFSDIVDFTGTADRMESEDLTELLNHYLTEMSAIALEHGATIDKYVGDAIVIFFGDPETRGHKEDALACVRMAVAMQRKMRELKKFWSDAGIEEPLRCRMGINTGFCTVGNFGSEHRMDYTIIGGGVNLASRLETASQPDEILISYETYALVKDDIRCEERGKINVKGFAQPVTTYAVTEAADEEEAEAWTLREEHPNLRLMLDTEAMAEDERRNMAQILRKALGMLNTPAPPQGQT